MRHGRKLKITAVALLLAVQTSAQTSRPRVIVVGVNGMEWDIIRPLLLKGEMPNLAAVEQRGISGRMQTISAASCPKVYSSIATSTPPEEHGITGFVVGGKTASTHMLKQEPLWSILSKHDVSVGLANVPATFPVLPVKGYMVSGMLTRGRDCEDGVLCSPKLSGVDVHDAVFPTELAPELMQNVGDFWFDCSRMPGAADLRGKEAAAIDAWLEQVARVRAQQSRLFDYLLSHRPTDFTMLVQSCEDRTGHWLYPVQPFNVGYDPGLHRVRLEAFPDQYRAFDKMLGQILKHVDQDTYLFIISDHGIKPLRELGPNRREFRQAHDRGDSPPIVAKHDFDDGDEVPGVFFAMGPNIRRSVRLAGLRISVFDIAPTVLHLYGIPPAAAMKGRVLTEIFAARVASASANSR